MIKHIERVILISTNLLSLIILLTVYFHNYRSEYYFLESVPFAIVNGCSLLGLSILGKKKD